MIQLRKTQRLLGLMLLMVTCMSCGGDDAPSNEPQTLSGKIDLFLTTHQSTADPGLSIAIRKNGETVYQAARGIAQINTQRAIDANTQFRMASVSKPMTALAVMQLFEGGKLNLNDKLLSFFPQLSQVYEHITIRHLLSHRSGLLDYIDDNTNLSSLDNVRTSEVLGFFNATSGFENLQFEPGLSGQYCNTGYVLLALIIEKISGQTFPDYMEEHIFSVAGMNDSFVIWENEHLGDHNDNYALSMGTSRNVKGFNALIYGASNVASTSNDMLKFTEALLNYELVNRETLNLMTQTLGEVTDIDTHYGLGWITGTGNHWHTGFISSPNDFWHNGGFDGYRTVLSINPDLDLQVIILTNGGERTQELQWQILNMARKHYKE